MSLFDIGDITSPTEIASEIIGERGSWSPAIYDLRALSFLQTSADQMRFTLPASTYGDAWQWRDEALHLFEINGLASNSANLFPAGKMVSESSTGAQRWPTFSGTDRSVLHEDAVYYVHGNGVWSSFWTSPSATTGPH